MKYLAVTFFFLLLGCVPKEDPYSFIGTPIKLGNIEIAENDAINKITKEPSLTYDAVRKQFEIINRKEGWRLPSQSEWSMIMEAMRKSEIPSIFKKNCDSCSYWTFDTSKKVSANAIYITISTKFDNYSFGEAPKDSWTLSTRLIRTIK
jgi:hypothetical protein